MVSTFDTKAYCRQSLIGGNYGLLNTTTFAPNPNYFRLKYGIMTLQIKGHLSFLIKWFMPLFLCFLQCSSLAPSDGKECPWDEILGHEENPILHSLRKTFGEYTHILQFYHLFGTYEGL